MQKINETIESAKAGDKAAVDSLFTLYRPFLRRLTFRAKQQLGKRVDDSDIVQDVCFRASNSIDKFSGETEPEFTGWLQAILMNRIRELHRLNTAQIRDLRREVRIDSADDSATVHWHHTSTDEDSPAAEAIRGEKALALLAAIDKLPPDQARAVDMRYLQQMKLKDIAEDMEKSIGAVAGLIRRGVDELQSQLKHDFGTS